METCRNNATGEITAIGKTFSVIIRENGHITVFSSYPFTIESHPQGDRLIDLLITIEPKDSPKQDHHDDVPPRSQPTVRKRGTW